MRKERILLILGIFMMILPYLGFPYSWKNVLFTMSGFAIVVFSYILFLEHKARENKEDNKKTFDNFKENGNVNFEQKETRTNTNTINTI